MSQSSDEVCVVLDSDSESTTPSLPGRRILRTPPHLIPKDRFNRHHLKSPPLKSCQKRRLEYEENNDWLQSAATRRRREVTSRDSEETCSCYSRNISRTCPGGDAAGTFYVFQSLPVQHGSTNKKPLNIQSPKFPVQQNGHRECLVEQSMTMTEKKIVVRILDDLLCLVKFWGYSSAHEICLNTLTAASLDEEARRLQIDRAYTERTDTDKSTDETPSYQRLHSANTERLYQRRDPRINRQRQEQPGMPFPDIEILKSMSSKGLFSITPPQLPSPSDSQNKDVAFSNMLVAWYMSGYYTALYQGLEKSKPGPQ